MQEMKQLKKSGKPRDVMKEVLPMSLRTAPKPSGSIKLKPSLRDL